MNEPYQIAVLRSAGWSAEEALRQVHGLLERNDIRLDQDSLLLLHNSGEIDPEPEHVNEEDGEGVLRRIASWPTMGSVDLCGREGMVTVSYLGRPETPGLQCILGENHRGAAHWRNWIEVEETTLVAAGEIQRRHLRVLAR